jgi:hypothetical protein
VIFSTYNSRYRRRRHRHGFGARHRRTLQIIVHVSLIISKKWHLLAQAPDPRDQISRNRVGSYCTQEFTIILMRLPLLVNLRFSPAPGPGKGCASPRDTIAVTSVRPLKGDVLHRRTMRHKFAVCRENRARIMLMSRAKNTLRFTTVLVVHDCIIMRGVTIYSLLRTVNI